MSDEELIETKEALRITRMELKRLHPWYCEDHLEFHQPCGCEIQAALDKTKRSKIKEAT